MKKPPSGFTLIELLVVITIIGILAGLITTNYLAVRQRGRDAQKKSDLKQLKTALHMYQVDYGIFPDATGDNQDVMGCGATGDQACGGPGSIFQAGSNIYIKRLPDDFYYYPDPVNDNFVVAAELENASDEDLEVSQSKCDPSCPGGSGCCIDQIYCLCND